MRVELEVTRCYISDFAVGVDGCRSKTAQLKAGDARSIECLLGKTQDAVEGILAVAIAQLGDCAFDSLLGILDFGLAVHVLDRLLNCILLGFPSMTGKEELLII